MAVAVHDAPLAADLLLEAHAGPSGAQPDAVGDDPGAFEAPPELAYAIPRSETIVLGGTAQDSVWGTMPDPAVARAIVARCARMVPEFGWRLERARVVAHRVGLRPGRPSVRLEEEISGERRVVHCYGHGGSGVTLSWGCAAEVARLVGRA